MQNTTNYSPSASQAGSENRLHFLVLEQAEHSRDPRPRPADALVDDDSRTRPLRVRHLSCPPRPALKWLMEDQNTQRVAHDSLQASLFRLAVLWWKDEGIPSKYPVTSNICL